MALVVQKPLLNRDLYWAISSLWRRQKPFCSEQLLVSSLLSAQFSVKIAYVLISSDD